MKLTAIYCDWCFQCLEGEQDSLKFKLGATRKKLTKNQEKKGYSYNVNVRKNLVRYIQRLKKLKRKTSAEISPCMACKKTKNNNSMVHIGDTHEWHRVSLHHGISISAKFSCSLCNLVLFTDFGLFLHFHHYHAKSVASNSYQMIQFKRAKKHFQPVLKKSK